MEVENLALSGGKGELASWAVHTSGHSEESACLGHTGLSTSYLGNGRGSRVPTFSFLLLPKTETLLKPVHEGRPWS